MYRPETVSMKYTDEMNYNELAKRVHENAVKHGFWDEEYSIEHYLMLVITEIGEMVQADRIDKRVSHNAKTYFHPRHTRRVFEMNFEHLVKGSVEDEMADVAIRLLDLAGKLEIDLDIAVLGRDGRTFNNFTFTENALNLCGWLVTGYNIQKRVRLALVYIEEWAKSLNIDLEWHIEQKMRYNETRPVRHGKRY